MLELFDLVISPSDTLKAAMTRMTTNKRGILFVCDESLHLVGVISDGDVRRALVNDMLLIAPISKAMNTNPVLALNAEKAFDLAKKYVLLAVPLVDAAGKLIGAAVDGDAILHADVIDNPAAAPPGMNALALIPARGGSKRIPLKNLVHVGGRSLLDWAISAAQNAHHVGRVIVSTDDPAIASAARNQGVEIPWMRPPELALDTSSSFDVVVHAVRWAVETLTPAPDYIVLLEPTAPLRSGTHIDQALDMLANSDADSVISVSEVPHTLHPEEVVIVEDGVLRPYPPGRTMDTRRLRGLQTPVYVQNGIVYAVRARTIFEQHSLYGKNTLPLIMSWYDFLDIDTLQDLPLADFRLRHDTPAH